MILRLQRYSRYSLLRCGVSSSSSISHTPFYNNNNNKYSTGDTSTTTGSSSEYDVLIVGGGLVGTAMACTLQQSLYTRELKIGIVDAQLQKQKQQQQQKQKQKRFTYKKETTNEYLTPGIRVSAIAHSSQRLLERIGVWQKLDPAVHPITAYDRMQVWDEIGGGVLRFDARQQGTHLPNLGHIVDNELLLGAMLERLQEGQEESGQNVDFIFDTVRDVVLTDAIGASQETIQWSEKLNITELPNGPGNASASASGSGSDLASAVLTSGDTLRASLIIAADGTNSPIRNRLNIPTSQLLYNQRAFVCSVETEQAHNTAFQRFLKTGLIAMLPVGRDGKYSNIVWSTSPEHARWLERLSPEQLIEAINIAFHDSVEVTDDSYSNIVDRFIRSIETQTQIPKQRRAAFSTDIPPRPPQVIALVDQLGRTPNSGSFPLRRQHAQQYVKPNLALIGDAAHTCHPIAGQGVNMGIADVAQLTHALQYAIQSGTRLGDAVLLRQEYEKPQYRRNETMLQGLEVIKRLFATNHDTLPGFPFVRALGMLGLDNMPFMKDWFVTTAIGDNVSMDHIGSSPTKE